MSNPTTARNLFSPYGRLVQSYPSGRKRFVVSDTSGAMYNELVAMYPVDEDGVPRVYTTVTDALAACTTGNGDSIWLAPDFTTALTAVELLAAETKGVVILPMNELAESGFSYLTANRATAALPAGTTGSIFTVTGKVRLLEIIGVVTTVIQTQACNLKITSTPTAAGLSAVDICANLNVSGNAANSFYSITGTFANALVNSTGAFVSQAAAIDLPAGTLDLITSATNTGSVKWFVRYMPLDPGARMIAA